MDKKEALLKKINEIGISKLIMLILAGVVLLLFSLPSPKDTTKDTTKESNQLANETISKSTQEKTNDVYVEEMEQKLSQALTKVSGIGKTEVMITVKSSKEVVINKDTPVSSETVEEKDSNGGTRKSSNNKKEEETILVTGKGGESLPYVIKELEPEIAGVVIIAEGGDNQIVINEITDAVEVLFGVPVHKIKVMKMKQTQ